MVAKKRKKAGTKINDLQAKTVSSKQAKGIKGGAVDMFKPVAQKVEIANVSAKKLFTC
jgi:hypothetical protein